VIQRGSIHQKYSDANPLIVLKTNKRILNYLLEATNEETLGEKCSSSGLQVSYRAADISQKASVI
jgi:hypothetical protein